MGIETAFTGVTGMKLTKYDKNKFFSSTSYPPTIAADMNALGNNGNKPKIWETPNETLGRLKAPYAYTVLGLTDQK